MPEFFFSFFFKSGWSLNPLHLLSYSEWLQREKRGAAVSVYGLAGPRGTGAPHSVPGLPETGESLQSSRCRAHGGTLQVRNAMVSRKHPEA